ncbi:hypothetical protein SEA_BEUFFERT_202 [Streptomyces phage Beuffert]|nr:hypothetical protein SEA_BEUFFERT_202 [Streptomyces phage Beuffert]
MATLPGHAWRLIRTDKKAQAFVYACKRCKCETLSGTPLPAPYDKVCK